MTSDGPIITIKTLDMKLNTILKKACEKVFQAGDDFRSAEVITALAPRVRKRPKLMLAITIKPHSEFPTNSIVRLPSKEATVLIQPGLTAV